MSAVISRSLNPTSTRISRTVLLRSLGTSSSTCVIKKLPMPGYRPMMADWFIINDFSFASQVPPATETLTSL